MPRSWSTTFTEIILTSHGGKWWRIGGLGISLLFLIPFSSFGSRPGTNGVGTGFYHLPLEVEFPRAPDPPNNYQTVPDQAWDFVIVWGRTRAFSFEFCCMYKGWQPESSALKRRDDVTARHMICPAPGNCTHIVIATTLRSLLKILLLTSPLDFTRAPCATVYHNISRIPTQPDAGIRTLTSWQKS